jgi:hypothetical protein
MLQGVPPRRLFLFVAKTNKDDTRQLYRKWRRGMSTDYSSVSLTPAEVELIVAALSHYELKYQSERPEKLADNIRALRDKLLADD